MTKGVVVLPKSVTPTRIASNITDPLDIRKRLEADPEEVKKLDGIAASGKLLRFCRPPWNMPMGFPDWK